MAPSKARTRIWALEGQSARLRPDSLAGEEPLEIRVRASGATRRLGVTMRTPGNDYELAAGLLYGEGIVAGPEDLLQIGYCPDVDEEQRYNVVIADLRGALPDMPERGFSAGSACGVCGSAVIADLQARRLPALGPGPSVTPELLYSLPEQLRSAQGLFAATGGLHAAALFAPDGTLVALREDIGRHNAVDKLVGWALLKRLLPLTNQVLLVSGRAGYEIVQKAVVAGIAVLCSISAPSSLAVALARRSGQTLVGFLRDRRCNVYTGIERILDRMEQKG
jgi:FdhD protein